ncbi:MAG: PrsW family intramembrane metalloprotease [Candidatus Thermoplasmatota archaeon]|nr:PrsW family intramembrane metalloprotease [Candidatus Thermoplasmatota archaeon]
MVNPLLGTLYGVLAAILPVISLTVWTLIFTLFFPYSRREFGKVVLFRGADRTLRYIMLGMTPIFFLAASIVSAGLSIMLEAFFMVFIFIFDSSMSPASQVLSLMSAGPIEETMKLLTAGLIYMTIYLIWRKARRNRQLEVKRDRVKDGMIIGCFAGAAFGFLESILYLFSNFTALALQGPSFGSIDPILWRFVLGVMVHALYTGIASAGLGRRTIPMKVIATAVFLTASVVLHALNNGIQGYIVLVLEMDNTTGWLISDILQTFLILIGIALFILAWKTSDKFSPWPQNDFIPVNS